MKRIINCETGEVIDRELTAEEIKQEKIDQKAIKASEVLAEAREADKAAILDRIGLTADELKTILG